MAFEGIKPKKFGFAEKITNLIKLFHIEMQPRVVQSKGTLIEFAMKNGVKYGCVIAPTLFHYTPLLC